MERANVGLVSQPAVEYSHLPGEEHNPLMESTQHATWIAVFLTAGRVRLANTTSLITGNVPFDPGDGLARVAPDVMVIPGGAGQEFGCYRVGIDGPMPSVCLEVLSKSNTRGDVRRRTRRFLELGISEVYLLDPVKDTVVQVDLVGGELVETSAVGRHSPGLNLTFVRRDGQLALCCVAGRSVRVGDDIGGLAEIERDRADRAEHRADAESARADNEAARADTQAARAEAEAARAEAEAARAQAEAARAQAEAARAEALAAEVAALRRLVGDDPPGGRLAT